MAGRVPITVTVNGQVRTGEVEPRQLLVHFLRDTLGLTGTKYSCGIGECGACTVHIDGEPVRSCSYRISRAAGKEVTTIEGLAAGVRQPLQQAWAHEDVPQCGYCQSGQLMSAAALLKSNHNPSDADIDAAMSGNICRCGTYHRIREAVHTASAALKKA